jgi:hypothetical protein
MGYELHITRKPEWSDLDGAEITLEEWLRYAGNDPELRIDGCAEAITPNVDVIRIESEGLVAWVPNGDETIAPATWFYWFAGNIDSKHPDDATRRKMFAIAQHFNASVQGDEGEFYGSDGHAIATSEISAYRVDSPKPWWKFW